MRNTLSPKGALLAARNALEVGIGINLGGGYHHAKPDSGEGFCIFADIPIAIRQLQAGCKDEEYNRILEENLTRIMSSFRADIVFLVGGCDPLAGDPLANLEMTAEGIVARDAMIVAACAERKIPVVFTLAGGYSQDSWKAQYQSISHLIDTYGVAK